MGVLLNEDRFFPLSITNSFSPVAANTTAEQNVTIANLKATDRCLAANKKTAQAGLGIVGHRVSGPNTLSITFSNNTSSSITPTAGDTYGVVIYRPEHNYTSMPA